MMSGYYDQHHRWEPLAEFHFNIDSDEDELFDENNYVYCLCSRVCIRDGVRRHVEKEEGSESDVELLQDSQFQEWEDESHVHFSVDTSYKKDEGASCYCSASHTDNYCSTDEHDPAQLHLSHALQPSDSGADLTYPDCLSDNYKLEKMDQDYPLTETNENYLSENTWDKFWAVNGERLIWASWIKKYSDYINPNYLDENNELAMDEQNVPKQHSADAIFEKETDRFKKNEEESMRDRKFSYDSKVNPYKKKKSNQPVEKNDKNVEGHKDDIWLPIARRRSCSENDRMLSPRTMAGTDSMTNVTKITLSSYDVTSSHVTSESTPTDDYSVSSSTSDDQSNDQTRIANIDENQDQPLSEELDTEQYWQFLWKKHFGEQYALHYANYLESHVQEALPEITIEALPEKKIEEKILDIECENSEGNSQEMPTVIEVQAQVDKIKLDDKVSKSRKKNKKSSSRYLGSVGVLLQNLLKEEQKKNQEGTDATEGDQNQNDSNQSQNDSNQNQNDTVKEADTVDGGPPTPQNDINNRSVENDGGDEPPEERTVSLKRSHELDEDTEDTSEIIKETLETMGFRVRAGGAPRGQLVYRQRAARLRPPRSRRPAQPRKTYFDDEGNPRQVDQGQESHDEREMQTDDECPAVKSDPEKDTDQVPSTLEQVAVAASIALPDDPDDPEPVKNAEEAVLDTAVANSESTKRRRRQKRHTKADDVTDMPIELQGNPKMLKYWKKRHSLFHRFDEGIKLDYESWFSVTPENVAWHIADKCRYDVLLDAFCGAGGNTIQFAHTCKKVIAVDIDPAKIALAQHNAEVYGVADRIEFIVGDFFKLAPTLKADAVFLSPPWGGPSYSESDEYDIETMLEPKPASDLLSAARGVSGTVALYLPRNTRTDQILSLAKEVGGSVEVEQSYLDRRFVAITAYFY
ncbi:trimethylguanosine synthase-like isoform X2 [Cydia pomonella]|uniref:trimethylguanosine synthase-like isoform X2 n=1 Tax=Cydia pomonella TaxID=82600 RepID=UPI002ADD9904|nr:trimethylguanosine synthase-like isoform X2 [Cydia pomonella]